MESTYDTITMALDRGVLTATLSNPPCNVMSVTMMGELADLAQRAAKDDAVRVIVLTSGDPDFFLAHFDINSVIDMPPSTDPAPTAARNGFQDVCVLFRDNPKPSIVKVAGRAGGGGIELAAACDMRFGVRGRTVLNQMEVALGILPAGTGAQNLPWLMGRGRALEMVLGGDDIDAETALQWGFLNRLFDNPLEMDEFVARLAERIASWPPFAVALAKQAIGLAMPGWHDALVEENGLAARTLQREEPRRLMRAFMDRGGQTREGECKVAAACLDGALQDTAID